MNLIDYRIKAIEHWQHNGHKIPKCPSCHAPIQWGGGFMLDDLKLTCNRCIETILTSLPQDVV